MNISVVGLPIPSSSTSPYLRACSNRLSFGLHKCHNVHLLKLDFSRRYFGAGIVRSQWSLRGSREFRVERNRCKENLEGDKGSVYGGVYREFSTSSPGLKNIVGRRGHVFSGPAASDWEPSLSNKEIRQSKDGGASIASKFRGSKEQQGKSSNYGNEGEDPYRILEDGRKVYLNEFDVITLLDPPPSLQPLDRSSYNHAAFLWKKIGDVPEERRFHLLSFLQPKLITKMWQIAGLRYDDLNYLKQDPATLLLGSPVQELQKTKFWYGFVTEVPWLLGWLSRFKMVFFMGNDGNMYGRVILGGYIFSTVANAFAPLYFQVRPESNVAASGEEECDLAFDFGDGQLQLKDSLPSHFPASGKHPPPFKNSLVAYVRPVGPGMLVGQMWYKHGASHEPRKFLGEFVLQQGSVDVPKLK